jgi:phosphate transport system protein
MLPFGEISTAPSPARDRRTALSLFGQQSIGRMSAVTHYEARLEADLLEIRSRVRQVSDLVEEQVRDAVRALLTHDDDLANRVILQDRIVNRETRALDQKCHGFVVRHLPVAHHLRVISAVLRLDVALERVGDYAVTVSRHSLRCSAPPPPTIARDIELIAQQSRESLAEALKSFHEEDAGVARRALGLTRPVDTTHDKAFEDLVTVGERQDQPVRDLFGYLRALYVLLRVSDQAENIAQETLFAAEGETKNPKIYRILFVDRANDCRSLMAEAYARRVFGECGVFSSGGWEPAPTIRPELRPFLESHGMEPTGLEPKGLPDLMAEPRHFHVVIGLEEGAREKFGEIPYKTVLLNWDLGSCPSGADDPSVTTKLEGIYREIAGRLKDLMDVLRGPDAV